MFDAMAEWMTVPLLQHEGGNPFERIGLAHISIAPYGVFKTRDGVDILISIQNDREWRVLAEKVLGDRRLAADPDFATNVERVKRRAETDGRVAAAFADDGRRAADGDARAPDIAFGVINDLDLLARHPHLRRITVGTPSGPASVPAPARDSRRRRAPLWRGAGARRAQRTHSTGSFPRNSDQSIACAAAAAGFAPAGVLAVPMISTSGIIASVSTISSLKSLR